MVGRVTVLQRHPHCNLWIRCPAVATGTLQMYFLRLRALTWGEDPMSPSEGLYRRETGGSESEKKNLRVLRCWLWSCRKKTTRQGMHVASGSWPREGIPRGISVRNAAPWALFLCRKKHFRLLTSRTAWWWICAFLKHWVCDALS